LASRIESDNTGTLFGCGAAVGIVGLLGFLILFFGAFVTVGVGEVGIVRHFGAVDIVHPDVFDPGFHMKMPFKDDVVVFNTRVVRADIDKVQAASRDGITITTHLVVNYHIDAKNAPLLLQNVGANYDQTVLAPAIQQAYKDVSGQYAALDMIQKRQELADKAQGTLTAKMAAYFIIIDQLSIVNLEFPQAFDDAIQATQIANQNRAKAQQDQERSKIEADTALIIAQGAANAQKAQATTLTPEYLQLQAIQKWDGHLPTYLTDGAVVPFIGNTVTGAK
jgi:regulator of protease activity HflC (stomatin/prohibitin superfamily)